MTAQKWCWLALAVTISIVTAVFLDLNANPPHGSGELETATRVKPSGEYALGTKALPAPSSPPASMESNLPNKTETEALEGTPTSKNEIQEARRPVRLYGDARIQPVYDLATNRVEGVRIVDVAPGSFWSELGVRSHDVILEFNGLLIETPSATVALMNAVSEAHRLSLRIRSAEGEIRFAEYQSSY